MDADALRWPEGVARHVLEVTDSTNSEAARLAAQGLMQPTWVMARRQTSARGRRGRVWISSEGNLAASLVMRPQGAPADAARRSFVAALALADALAAVCGPRASVALKWPNDVLLNGGKVAGILLESAGASGLVSHLVIGFGVNLAEAPPREVVEPGATVPVSVLGETGLRVAPEDFLTVLAAAFARWEAHLTTFGFEPIRTAWTARAARLGERITARLMNESLEGVFEGLDRDGALVLRTASGARSIPAADVFF